MNRILRVWAVIYLAAAAPALLLACAEVVDSSPNGTPAEGGSGGIAGSGGRSGAGNTTGTGNTVGSGGTSGSFGSSGSSGASGRGGAAGIAGSGVVTTGGAAGTGNVGMAGAGALGTGGSIPACSVPGLVLCDDFEDGDPNGWTPNGGRWLVTTDGTSAGGASGSGGSGGVGTSGGAAGASGGASGDNGVGGSGGIAGGGGSIGTGGDNTGGVGGSGVGGTAGGSGAGGASGVGGASSAGAGGSGLGGNTSGVGGASSAGTSGSTDVGGAGAAGAAGGAGGDGGSGPLHVFTDGPLAYEGGLGTFLSSAGSTTWTDQTIEAKMKVLAFGGTSASYRAGIIARYSPGSSNYYFFAVDAHGNLVLLRASSVPSGATGTCGAAAGGVPLGSWVTLRMQVSGPMGNVHIRTFLNGNLVHDCTTTSSTSASGMIGLYTYGSGTNAMFDNVKVSTP